MDARLAECGLIWVRTFDFEAAGALLRQPLFIFDDGAHVLFAI